MFCGNLCFFSVVLVGFGAFSMFFSGFERKFWVLCVLCMFFLSYWVFHVFSIDLFIYTRRTQERTHIHTQSVNTHAGKLMEDQIC